MSYDSLLNHFGHRKFNCQNTSNLLQAALLFYVALQVQDHGYPDLHPQILKCDWNTQVFFSFNVQFFESYQINKQLTALFSDSLGSVYNMLLQVSLVVLRFTGEIQTRKNDEAKILKSIFQMLSKNTNVLFQNVVFPKNIVSRNIQILFVILPYFWRFLRIIKKWKKTTSTIPPHPKNWKENNNDVIIYQWACLVFPNPRNWKKKNETVIKMHGGSGVSPESLKEWKRKECSLIDLKFTTPNCEIHLFHLGCLPI